MGKKQNIALKIGEKCWTPILCKYELKKNIASLKKEVK